MLRSQLRFNTLRNHSEVHSIKIQSEIQNIRKDSIVLEDFSPHKGTFKKQNIVENKNYDL